MSAVHPIPPAALSQHIIALGKTGSGKSSKLRVLVEQLLAAGDPVCIVDPKGDWWGLKSSADGRSAGFPIVIFGGEHADVPINAHSGAHVAEIVATGNRPAIIDLGGWMIGERTRFFIEFAGMFFKLARGARHLVIDEVHNFAPQGKVLDPDAGKMLHWANRLASEGRGKGITLIAASQRPQKVHKDFLTSCETLIAGKVIHKLDRDAIKDWIDGCADLAKGREVLASLAQLKRPEAWVWSPEIDFGPKVVTFPMFRTYDSFAPQAADAGKLKGWAEVDLEEVKSRLLTVVQEAEANDPKRLRARIAELERELRKPRPPEADAGALQEERRKGLNEGLTQGRQEAAEVLEGFARQIGGAAERMRWDTPPPARAQGMIEISKSKIAAIETNDRSAPATPARAAPRQVGGQLSAAGRKILTVLAQHRDGCTAGKLALLSGYSYSGGFRNALSELRTAGYLEGGNTELMRVTDAGLAQGPFDPLPSGRELLHYWLTHSAFGQAARKILEQLAEHPPGLTADQLARRTSYEYSGGFRNALSELRTAGVIVGRNSEVMRLHEDLT